jgi:hypothetical protein
MDDPVSRLLKTLESAPPPEGVRERVYQRALHPNEPIMLSPFQKLLFKSPLTAAAVISVSVSGLLYAIFGNGYPALLLSLF